MIYLQNLNTSHVKVNLVLVYRTIYNLLYLNTSHVKVNHKEIIDNKEALQNLNTSHVKVNLTHIFKSSYNSF